MPPNTSLLGVGTDAKIVDGFTDPEAVAASKAAGAINVLGWTPPYPYTAGTTSTGIRQHVVEHAGAGKLDLHPPAMP